MCLANLALAAAPVVRVPHHRIVWCADLLDLEQRIFGFWYRSPQNWFDVFKAYYGPLLKTFGALDPGASGPDQRFTSCHALTPRPLLEGSLP